jgi:predicted Rossmann fold nucleotide-binding protein DprA/Smf involved in DNA uptake
LAVALTCHAIGENVVRRALWRDIRGVLETHDAEQLSEWADRSLKPEDAVLVKERLALIDDAVEAIENWSLNGIEVITELDERYPRKYKEKLKDQNPAVVYVAGNVGLLSMSLIGVVGSRNVDDDGAAFASSVAYEAARLGYGIVSGGARGVDQVAMRAALEAGAPSVGVLADSLQKTVNSSATGTAIESGNVCLLSPFSPTAGFSVGNAMGRNKLVYSLSDATVVVAAAEGSGGTWAGAVEALEKDLCVVLVRDRSEGSAALAKKGGVLLESPAGLADAIASALPAQGKLL